MKKFLFFTSNYLPNAGANGICVHEIISGLKKKGFEIHLICYQGRNESSFDIIDGVSVYRVKMPFNYRLNNLSNQIKNLKLAEFTRNISFFLKRLKLLLYLPFYPMTSIIAIYRHFKLASDLHKKNKYDLVISSFNPIEGLVASNLLKRKDLNLKFAMYVLDSLSNTGSGKFLSSEIIDRIGWNWEKRLYTHADLILNLKSHMKHHSQKRYDPYRHKMEFVDVPLLKRKEPIKPISKYGLKKPKIVYTGSLDSIKRNPLYACEIFKEITNLEFQLEFYSKGDCEAMLQAFETDTHGKITRKGFIQHKESLEKISEATFLLSIGNKNSDMIPSKIFEYMSTGKPIIHFYDNEIDSSIVYLRDYPLALLIKNDKNQFKSNLIKIETFMEDFKNKKISFDKVESIFKYNKPEHTIEKITNIL